MEYIYPLIGGISAKLYDDIVDEGFEVNDTFKEALKGAQWITLALASIGDFNYSIITYVLNVLNHWGNPEAFKFPYEFSLLCVYPIFILLSFHTRTSFTIMDYLIILASCLAMFIEPMIIIENASYRKLIIRSSSVVVFICVVIFGLYFNTFSSFLNLDYFTLYFNLPTSSLNISTAVLKLLFYGIGYFAMSSLFQVYLINKPGPAKEDKKEKADEKAEDSKSKEKKDIEKVKVTV
jgi:hypothetical protein